MKHLCCSKFLFFILFFTTSLLASLESKSAMVYYGKDIPYTLVGIHDYIIVQPDNVNVASHGFKSYRDNIYAYVSIGELEVNQPYYDHVDPKWIVAENKIWHSKVADISNSDYHEFLYTQVIEPKIAAGFKHFFFDTLDSYHIAAKTPKEKEKMRQGLIHFINTFSKRYPDAKLIVNRGFEVIDDIHQSLEAVLFESLFEGLSSKDLSYKSVSKSDRAWLMGKIKTIRQHDVPVIALDYVSIEKPELIHKTIKSIEALGLIPYVGDRDLMRIGNSSKNALKREVLLLYDGSNLEHELYRVDFGVFQYLSTPLEYMGYVPILYDISSGTLSDEILQRYAGVIVWLNGDYALKKIKAFEEWIFKILQNNLRLLFLETLEPSVHSKIFEKLNIKTEQIEIDQTKTKVTYDHDFVGFEIDPFITSQAYLFHPKDAKTLLQIQESEHNSTLAAITSWGGYVMSNALMTRISQNDLWTVNPFKLFKSALKLSSLVIPDPTTENGKRLFFVHMDGDGIMNRVEWNPERFAGEILYEEVFSRYHIPTSLSIIEAETASYGLYPKVSSEMEDISKQLFSLQHVEAATHTFTHPFSWNKIVNDSLDPAYHLKVKNYDFSLNREINGSLNYINTKLSPKEKPSRMTFWSGDCVPTETTLAYMYQNNFLHINGGDTTITNTNPWLSLIAPYGMRRGDYYQIYAGAQNENVYTNDWLGPFWGFKKVIQTFKLTNAPRRFKPIDIYFHTYSGSKRASINALHKVYQWAMKQDVMPIYTSEYIPKVMDFYTVSLANEGNRWLIKGTDALKTVRVSKEDHVNFNASSGAVGIKQYLSSNYIHLDQNREHLISLESVQRDQNYLIDANVALKSYEQSPKQRILDFKGHVPALLRYHVAQECKLSALPKADQRTEANSIVTLSYQKQKDLRVTVICR